MRTRVMHNYLHCYTRALGNRQPNQRMHLFGNRFLVGQLYA